MRAQRLLTVMSAAKRAVNEFLTDNCPHMAAAISFYLLLCLFPLVLAAISIAGFFTAEPSAESNVIQAVTSFLPSVSEGFIQGTILEVSRGWGATGVIATIGLIWAGMALFNAIRKSMNTAWGIKQPRSFFHERLLELLMLTGIGTLILVSIGLTTAFEAMEDAKITILGQQFVDGSLLWNSAVIATSVFTLFLALLFLNKLVPNTKVQWRHAAMGALLAAALLELVKYLFGLFMADYATINFVYGSISIIIILMIWAYMSAVVFLFCAKLTSVYPKVKASLAAAIPDMDRPEQMIPVRTPSMPATPVNTPSIISGSTGAVRHLMSGRRLRQGKHRIS